VFQGVEEVFVLVPEVFIDRGPPDPAHPRDDAEPGFVVAFEGKGKQGLVGYLGFLPVQIHERAGECDALAERASMPFART